MERRVAEVAVPRDIDQTFDYRVPAHLGGSVGIGVRARVPFRDEQLVGYVVGLKTESEYPGRLLELQRVLDEHPVIDPDAMRLARWIAEYYVTPLGMVLRAMVPSGLEARAPQTRSFIRLAMPLAATLQAVEELSRTAPQQKAILEALLAHGRELPRGRLLEWVGCSSSPLRALERKGLVAMEERPRSHRVPTQFHERAPALPLSRAQQQCLETICSGIEGGRGRYLLHGVNASGKTEIYVRSVEHALKQGKGAIAIVPEISLTPQLIARFRSRLGERVAIYHSQLTEAQRAREWGRLVRGEAQVAVGVRAAIFAPLERLGLVIVDEEHESTYKQEEPAPRYHARHVALRRAELSGATAVLGSATPSVDSSWRARRGGLELLELKERVVGGSPPRVRVVDLGGQDQLLTPTLKGAIEQRREKGEQVMLLLNRRGFSSCVLCRDCRTTQRCAQCHIALVYHFRAQRLVCHYCGRRYGVGRCRSCGSGELAFMGWGTEQAELGLNRAFPGMTIARMDSDVVRRGEHGRILESFRQGEIGILLGTQMIGLGLDFPNVTLVGVLSADTLLDRPEYQAGERTFQLISQAVGRTGRGPLSGEVIVQTSHPEHYAIASASRQDYGAFYGEELEYRRALNYPPFSHLVRIRCEDRREERARRTAERLLDSIGGSQLKGLETLGPFQALPYRFRGAFRQQLVLKAKSIRALSPVLRESLHALGLWGHVRVDVDPQSTM